MVCCGDWLKSWTSISIPREMWLCGWGGSSCLGVVVDVTNWFTEILEEVDFHVIDFRDNFAGDRASFSGKRGECCVEMVLHDAVGDCGHVFDLPSIVHGGTGTLCANLLGFEVVEFCEDKVALVGGEKWLESQLNIAGLDWIDFLCFDVFDVVGGGVETGEELVFRCWRVEVSCVGVFVEDVGEWVVKFLTSWSAKHDNDGAEEIKSSVVAEICGN